MARAAMVIAGPRAEHRSRSARSQDHNCEVLNQWYGSVVNKLILLITFCFSSNVSCADVLSEARIPATVEMSLLVYNTHGLPAVFARDKPKVRFPKIGNLTQRFDVSLFQEDFAHHHLLSQHVKTSADIVRGATKSLPKCWVCSGSGLTFISKLEKRYWKTHVSFIPFEKCSGWLNRSNDCFAQKGFQLIFLESNNGHRIYIVNTHLDAGDNKTDQEVRASQLDKISLTLDAETVGEAVFFAGDLNLDWKSPADKMLLQNFSSRLNLVLAQKGGDASNDWKTLDYIYYRSGIKTTISVVSSGEVDTFANGTEPLSDHPALFANFRIQ